MGYPNSVCWSYLEKMCPYTSVDCSELLFKAKGSKWQEWSQGQSLSHLSVLFYNYKDNSVYIL